MTQDAESYAKEDEEFKERIASKNSLEGYLFQMKSMLDDEKTKDMIGDEDRDNVKSTIEDALQWLEGNQLASKDEYDDKKNEVEEVGRRSL
jgi:L1 cell adhesion molecule like protein